VVMVTKRVMATATRVAEDKQGEASKGDGDGDKGVRQGMVSAKKRAMATAQR
jgi:hypothetical protein